MPRQFDLCTGKYCRHPVNPKQKVVNTATRLTSISLRPSTQVCIMQSAVAALSVAADAPTAKGCARANAARRVTESEGRGSAIYFSASACSASTLEASACGVFVDERRVTEDLGGFVTVLTFAVREDLGGFQLFALERLVKEALGGIDHNTEEVM